MQKALTEARLGGTDRYLLDLGDLGGGVTAHRGENDGASLLLGQRVQGRSEMMDLDAGHADSLD